MSGFTFFTNHQTNMLFFASKISYLYFTGFNTIIKYKTRSL